MKSIALRLASVGLVVGALTAALPSRASAAELDCSGGCSLATLNFASFGGTALFSTTSYGSTGTGLIDPFVRIQDNGTESGQNTSGTLVKDEKDAVDLRLDHLPIANIQGVTYYEFLLDANENNNATGRLISLNNVQICIGATGGLTGTTSGGGPNADRTSCTGPNGGTLAYSFGAYDSDANHILLDYDLSGGGSGSGDLFMYIPTATLGAPNSPNQYVYLFSQFGLSDPPKGDTDSGFEEWAIQRCFPNCGVYINPTDGGSVPEPSSLVLLGVGVLGLAAAARRRAAKA